MERMNEVTLPLFHANSLVQCESMKLRDGGKGWIGLAIYITLWDVASFYRQNGETLSHAFEETVRHPIKRWPTALAWAYITVHLFGWIPETLDPLSNLTNIISPPP